MARKFKVYLDRDIRCPLGHVFWIQRKTSSMGKYVKTRCKQCRTNFKVLAGVVVLEKNTQP